MSPRPRAGSAMLLGTLALAGCRDSIGPGAMSFSAQPGASIAGELIRPAIEVAVRDAFGDPAAGTVTIALDPNPCSWRLSGTLAVQLEDGVARFADLSLDKIGRGYTLRTSFGGLNAVTRPFDITSPVTGLPVIHDNLLCTKPNDQTDAESLTWVPEDDAFWIADDERVGIYQVDRLTGRTLYAIGRSEFAAALPDAELCDDGDGDPNTTCTYLDEFEQVAYDVDGRILYVVNTVNTASDRPAIYRLLKGACAGCWTIQDWQPLPLGPTYSALAVVDGNLLVADGHDLYGYDYETNQVANVNEDGRPLPPEYTAPSDMVGLTYDGSSMWILTQARFLYEVRWSTKTRREEYDLRPFSIATPKGLEMIKDTIYVLEGDTPQPINVFTFR